MLHKTQDVFFFLSDALGKASRTNRRRLELLWSHSVCLTDHTDLEAKTYSTAPVLTRELPKGIEIVGKYNLVSI